MPSRRPLKDICFFAGATAQKEDARDSLHLLLIFPNLQARFPITSVITHKLFVYPNLKIQARLKNLYLFSPLV